jgi:hypothetical protein
MTKAEREAAARAAERTGVMRDIVEWLKDAPRIKYWAHGGPTGLVQRERRMYVDEAARELERQIEDGTA